MRTILAKLFRGMRSGARFPAWRVAALVVSVIVVFSTTYALILPAITLSESEAEAEPGIFLEPGAEGDWDDSADYWDDDDTEAYEYEDYEEDDAFVDESDTPAETYDDEAQDDNYIEEGQTETADAQESDDPSVWVTDEYTDEDADEYVDDYAAESVMSAAEPAETVYAEGTREVVVEGADYRILVSFGVEACIPEEAVFKAVSLDRTPDYDAYAEKALEAAADPEPNKVENSSALGVFDLTIYDAEGHVVEPAAPISVTVDFGKQLDEAMSVCAVHFAESGQPEETAESGETWDDVEEVTDDAADTADSAAETESPVDNTEPEVIEAVVDGGAVNFEAESFSVYVIVGTTIEKTILAGDGNSYRISVTYGADAGIPEGAQLEASEILPEEDAADDATAYEEYLDKTREALGLESGAFSFARIFDIWIADAGGEKVKIAAPVHVSIELADKDSSEEAAAVTKVVHFADMNAVPDVVSDVDVSGETIRFDADGFSAYAIVEGPPAVPVGWTKVSSVEELMTMAAEGVYIGHVDGFYLTDGITQINASRTGITKTKPAQSYPADNAVRYYFEQVEGSSDQCKVYCLDGENRKYVLQSTNSLNLTTDAGQATVFTIEPFPNSADTFRIKGSNNYYWNMQGGANGASFAAYDKATDPNAKLYFWHFQTIDRDPYSLDGKTYGLMNWNGGTGGKAMMADAVDSYSLSALPLTVLSNAEDDGDKLFVPNDSEITQWSFHWVTNDMYTISCIADGSTKYLKISTDGISLVSAEEDAGLIQVVPGSGVHEGEVCLKSGQTTLTYSGNIDTGFCTGGSTGSEWLHFVELSELTSDYFMTHSASKVSVSDTEKVNTGAKVIVYTRVWNEDKKRYDLFAIGHDGALVPCYESGDSIEWVGGMLNTMLWQFTEYQDDEGTPTNYYELFNEYSGQYIAPQLTGERILSDEPVGINLDGRRKGQYYSSILEWDEDHYTYTGYKVENGHIVSCPQAEAMDFYFAVMQEISADDKLHTVTTVDNDQHGITMKIKNFAKRADMSGFLNNDAGGAGTALQQGLLSSNLGTDGYPTAAGGSLGSLYSGESIVNRLFIDSTYRSSGYYEYDSSQNFASLRDEDGDRKPDTFVVYKELGSYDSGGNRNTLKHGQFFPFNDLEPGVFASVNGKNLYSATAEPLPDTDPRKNEQLYLIKNTDPYFALELEASFVQTPSGLDAWGHDIIYEFTGDDDFWLYVDGELVIDLGGIHSAVAGTVNFRTGEVNVNGTNTTLKDIFYQNYLERNHTQAEAEAYVNGLFEQNSAGDWVFKDNSTHTMRIFYMERGAGASNLHMRFNLASVKPGTVQLGKALSGVDTSEAALAVFPYQIRYRYKDTEGVVHEELLTNALAPGEKDYAFYKDTVNPVPFKAAMNIDGVNYQNVFLLKPGEIAEISFPPRLDNMNDMEYELVECGVDPTVYDRVSINGEDAACTPETADGTRKDYSTGFKKTGERSIVNYVNDVRQEALRTLTIGKKLYREDGETVIPYETDHTPFAFRLYLGTEYDDDLPLADMHTYHVKDPEGYYCRWDVDSKRFVSVGKRDYEEIEDKKAVTFTTSMNGSISRIPADYTVEIRGVLAGTKYMVEERDSEIPDGYSRQKCVYYEDMPSDGNAGAVSGSDESDPAEKTIVTGFDPYIEVRNLKGWGLRVNKAWSDEDYMSDRAPTYFAVFIKKNDTQGHGDGHIELVNESVRQLKYGEQPQSMYWYFNRLENGTTFDRYIIREVRLSGSGWHVEEDGRVTGISANEVHSIHEEGQITLSGKQKGETQSSDFHYTVFYSTGTVTDDANVRVDTVTNNRPGIVLKKTRWDGETPLAGAVFMLTDQDGNEIGTFRSGEDGMITTAFLRENVAYTLTETKAPEGWYGLQAPMTVTLDHNNKISVSGVDALYYDVDNHTAYPTLTVKDRPYTFRAVKQDGDKKEALAGVKFALHRQVTVDGVTSIDLNPMPGYENLVTDAQGIIPKLDQTLRAGTYELREKEPLEGYQMLSGYIQFTISETGAVTLGPHPDEVTLTGEMTDSGEGLVSFVLTVSNSNRKSVSVWKTNEAHAAITTGAGFELYLKADYDDAAGRPLAGKTPVCSGETGTDGILSLSRLAEGEYRLIETEPPEGYIPLSSAVNIYVTSGGVTAVQGTSQAEVARDVEGNPYRQYWVPGQDSGTYQIRIWNNPGYELPNSGGPGTRVFTVLGLILAAGAGVLLLCIKKVTGTLKGER